MGAPISFSKGRARDPPLPSLEKKLEEVSKITRKLFLWGLLENYC